MYNIISWNVNGFRSVLRKGYLDNIWKSDYDFICFQEVKLSDVLILEEEVPKEYFIYSNISSNKGRNGVVVLSKKKAQKVTNILGDERFDKEGRYLELDYEQFILINLYMPHGKRDKSDIPYKLSVGQLLLDRLKKMENQNLILATDFNIARDINDVSRASSNMSNTMFTSKERELVKQLCLCGFYDVFREKYPDKIEYTWWTYAFNAREKNMGWRIDYFFVSLNILNQIRDIKILNNQYGSDHCPIEIQIEEK